MPEVVVGEATVALAATAMVAETLVATETATGAGDAEALTAADFQRAVAPPLH
jgi:hypothetical protein